MLFINIPLFLFYKATASRILTPIPTEDLFKQFMEKNKYDIIIVGAGPAGLMAAIESFSPKKKILILEKMHKPAIKLKLSGKGRCNITNEAGLTEFISHFGKNGRFLKFAFSEFYNRELLVYFEKLGVHFKLERGGRYFPQSDSAMEIANALLNRVEALGISLQTNAEVCAIAKTAADTFLVSAENINRSANKRQKFLAQSAKVLIATGGKSYPKTGSSGGGYHLASELGHTITPLSPSLVPLETAGDTARKLQGLSLRNIRASVWLNNKKTDEQFGEMVFTDFGLSGPVILTLSKSIVQRLQEKQSVLLSIDLKPALEHKQLDARILREIKDHGKQRFKSLLKSLLPKKLIPVFLEILDIPEDKSLSELSAAERKKLRLLLKDFSFQISGFRSYDQAIVTSGGVSIKEINPQTMESRLVKGLYFAGEILDLNADTGGFNLQGAFSTGWVAGRAMSV